MTEDSRGNVSRRSFIKGVIATGAVASGSAYLFRSASVAGQPAATPGAVERLITLNVNGQDRRIATFVQKFGANSLRKELVLVRESGSWRIASEKVADVK